MKPNWRLTFVLLLLFVLESGSDALFPADVLPAALASSAAYTLSGRVYEGNTGVEPPNSAPIQGVTVSLYCSNNQGQQGSFLRSATTDAYGWYGLDVTDGEATSCEYLNIIETNASNYISNGATTVSGNVITADWIEYATPLDNKTLTGNKFWDKLPVLSGYVYEGATGTEPPDSAPIQGVTVSLYCSNNHLQQGTFLRNTTTDAQGWYGLGIQAGDACDYFNIIETDPAGYTSNGASTEGGNVIDVNWIEFASPLDNKTLTGNKFWDNALATATPTPSPTPTATPTSTRTPTAIPTSTPTQTPTAIPTSTPTRTPTGQPTLTPTSTLTPTPTGQPTATPTPTPTGQPTATWTPSPPATCQELLVNGDFERGELAPWDHEGAAGLGPGRDSAYAAWLGDADNVAAELWQGVAVPPGADPVILHFWWRVESPMEQPDDAMEVLAQYGDDQADHLLTLPAAPPLHTWREVSLDLSPYAGQDIALTFFVHTDAAYPSTFRLDDVSLQACAAHGLYLPLIRK